MSARRALARAASPWAPGLLVLGLGLVSATGAAAGPDARTITIFEGRQFSVPVPAGWSFEEGKDPHLRTPTLKLGDPGKEVVLQMTFIPDPSGRLASREAIEAEARRILQPYVATSVEKEIRLTSFESPGGRGAYAAFTDAKLDPRHVPEDEWLIGVSGVRTFKGGYILFTLLTNAQDSPLSRTALDIAVSGARQVKAPVAF